MRKLLLFSLILSSSYLLAGSFTAKTGNRNWSSNGTWTPSGIPGPGDTALIPFGANITVDLTTNVHRVENQGTLIFQSTRSLTIGGDFLSSGTLNLSSCGNQTPLFIRGGFDCGGPIISSATTPYPTIQFEDITNVTSGFNSSGIDVNFYVHDSRGIHYATLTFNSGSALVIGGELKIDSGAVNNNALGTDFRNLVLVNNAAYQNNGALTIITGSEDTSDVALRVIGTGNSLIDQGLVNFQGTTPQDVMIQGLNPFTVNVGTMTFGATSTTIRGSGSALRVLGSVTVSASSTLNTNNKLVLGATAALKGQLEVDGIGTLNGDITIERYLQNPSLATWRYFGFPMLSNNLSDINGLSTISNPKPVQVNAYSYNAVPIGGGNDTATGWVPVTDWSTALLSNAYIVYSSSNAAFQISSNPISLSGDANLTSKVYALGYSFDPDRNAANNRGWNFIPNPFPVNISTVNLLGDGVNFPMAYKGVHIFNSNTQQYVVVTAGGGPNDTSSISGTTSIPMTGGFWVKSDAIGQNLLLQPSHTSADALGVDMHRTKQQDALFVYLKDNSGRNDVVKVFTEYTATDGMDIDIDGYKRHTPNSDYPSLYFTHGMDEMSMNGISRIDQHHSLDLAMRKGASNSYTISAYVDKFNPATQIYLEDKKLNRFHNLRNSDYSFTQSATDMEDRFILHLSNVAMSIDEHSSEEVFVSKAHDATRLHLPPGVLAIEVFDITGAILFRAEEVNSNSFDLTQWDTPGIQLVRIYTENGVTVLKF
ncbi:MAG: hypothetical protein LPK79_07210 [Bacteroidota bacterium]|nr:hypothetical protein [Bacteroidota bacterium]